MKNETTTQALSLNSEALGWLRQHTVKAVIGGVEQPAIDARDIHEWLQSAEQYADWIKKRIRQRKLQAGRDFCLISAIAEIKRSGRGVALSEKKSLCP